MSTPRTETEIPPPARAPAAARTHPVSFHVSPAYRAWLDGLAQAERSRIGDVLDRALVRYAQTIGHEPPAPRR